MSSFVKVAKVAEIPEGRGFSVDIHGRRVALFRSGGSIYAIDDACTHEEASLSMGFFDGEKVTCPLHFAQFLVATGHPLEGPATEPVKTYPVRIEGGDVELALD